MAHWHIFIDHQEAVDHTLGVTGLPNWHMTGAPCFERQELF